MGDTAIRVRGLGKLYRIGARRDPSDGLRHAVEDGVRRLGRRLRGRPMPPQAASEDFWALKDVSFEVKRGECVGVIGRNGAGKSTLLKLLSRITEPTTGEIGLRGRVGSLLEVGTGFHPELTGRENIFLNGSVLGMSRHEIRRKFDEIVAFSEVEKFLDTPVKRYSSGMYVRLAFAVAAHLEPEILIVDEVLAVGDAAFQRKCIDRMSDLAGQGKTVLFVSHNLQIISRLCLLAVQLKRGCVTGFGLSEEIVQKYLAEEVLSSDSDTLDDRYRSGTGLARFRKLWMVDDFGLPTADVRSCRNLTLRFEIDASRSYTNVDIAVVVSNSFGLRVVTSWNREVEFLVDIRQGLQTVDCRFDRLPVRAGQTIVIGLWLATAAGEVLDCIESASAIEVLPDPDAPNYSTSPEQGIVVCEHSWRYCSDGGW